MKLDLKKVKGESVILGILILLLLILRIPSIFEPHWNEIEGTYAVTAHFLRSGNDLYTGIWANKTPIIYLLYLLPSFTGALNLIFIKILSLLSSIISIFLLHKISNALFKNRVITIISSVIGIFLLGTPILEANVAYIQNFMLLISLVSLYLILTKELLKPTYGFITGIFISLLSLLDISAISIAFALLAFALIKRKTKDNLIKNKLPIVIGMIIPWIILIAILLINNQLDLFYEYVIKNPLSEIPQDTGLGFLIFKNTLLARTAIFITISIATVYMYKRKLIKENTFLLSLWSFSTIFTILLYQSQNPSTHVLIVTTPLIAIFVSTTINRIFLKTSSLQTIQILSFSFFVIYFTLNTLTMGSGLDKRLGIRSYYNNFYNYLVGKNDTAKYTSYFGEETYITYKLNSYLSQNIQDDEKIYIWTKNPWIYQFGNIKPTSVKFLTSYIAYKHLDEVKFIILNNQVVTVGSCMDDKSQDLQKFLLENDFELVQELKNICIYKKVSVFQ